MLQVMLQQNMEKNNNQNQNELRLSQRKMLPNLRKSQSAAKNFITLSKVQVDKNIGIIEQPQITSNVREVISSYSHKRIISGMNVRQFVQSQMSKTYRNFFQALPEKSSNLSSNFVKQKSASMSNPSQKELTDKNQQAPLIQKAKISTKSIGSIKGYSVNSHPGSISTANQDRICVITNLNKTANKQQQISFFSIYDGKNGSAKAEYFRDNFHTALVRDKEFTKDIQMAIKRALMTIQDNFVKSNAQSQNNSTTDFLLAIVMDGIVYIASMGDNKMIASLNQGSQLTNPLISKQPVKRSNSMPKFNKNGTNLKNVNNMKISIKVLRLETKDLDFVVLGSEGLFENFSQLCLAKKFWRQILDRCNKNFHIALGQTTNTIMNEVFQQVSTKNVSLILIAFKNVENCFQQSMAVQLPYIEGLCPISIEQI